MIWTVPTPDPIARLLPLLGQQSQTGEASARIWFWLIVLVLAALLIIAVALFIRRQFIARNEENPGAPGFTIGDLRDLHAAGQLSDEEFEAAKKRMIARSRAMIDAPEDERPVVGEPGEDLSRPDRQDPPGPDADRAGR